MNVNSLENNDQPLAAEPDHEIVIQQILSDPKLSQYFIRTNDEEQETVVAYFRCKLRKSQQRYVLHFPLVPGFRTIPEVSAMVQTSFDPESEASDRIEGNPRIRVTDKQKFGIRAEVVLPRPSDSDVSVLIEMIATG